MYPGSSIDGSAIVWPPARRAAGTACVTSKHELVSGCLVKACFCLRSIFCAIQSSWISAIAGVSTMAADGDLRGTQKSRSAEAGLAAGVTPRQQGERHVAVRARRGSVQRGLGVTQPRAPRAGRPPKPRARSDAAAGRKRLDLFFAVAQQPAEQSSLLHVSRPFLSSPSSPPEEKNIQVSSVASPPSLATSRRSKNIIMRRPARSVR